jgi:Bacteriophage related domain of unknown function
MPCLSYTDARDQIFAIINAAWADNGPVQWPDMVNPDIPPAGSWIRVTLRHQTGEQVSLSDASAKKRWSRVGTVWIQVFTLPGDGGELNYQLSHTMATAFEGVATSGGIWFRNVRLNEIGPSNGYTQSNVLVEFEYDEIH